MAGIYQEPCLKGLLWGGKKTACWSHKIAVQRMKSTAEELTVQLIAQQKTCCIVSICNALLQEPEPPRRRGLEDLLATLADGARAGDTAAGGSDSQDGAPGAQSSTPAEQSATQPSMAQLEEGDDQQSAPARSIGNPQQCSCNVSGLPQSYTAVQALHPDSVAPMQTFPQPLLYHPILSPRL